MTEEYGPPIAVNGKRPEWLGDDERCLTLANFGDRTWHAAACQASQWIWNMISQIRLRADHPYYQSAEYKASVGEPEGCGIKLSHSPVEGVREIYVDGLRVTVAPEFDPRPAMTEAEMIAALEATGHTVTPPSVRANVRSTVVPVWALDRAANMAGWDCWDAVHRDNDFLRDSIIAHAETITKHETPPDPLAGDREFLAGLDKAANCMEHSHVAILEGIMDADIPAAMAYLRENKWRL